MLIFNCDCKFNKIERGNYTMHKVKALIVCSILIVIVLSFIGCQTTGRTAGDFIDDVGIEAGIRAKLLEDPVVSPFSIHITLLVTI